MPPLRYRQLLGLSYSNPYKTGQAAGQIAGAGYSVRGWMLARLVEQGKIKVQDLSAQDLAAAAPQFGQGQKPGGGGSGLFDVLGNLGSDIVQTTKGLPAGILNTGEAFLSDIAGTLATPLAGQDPGVPGSDVKAKVVDPTVAAYKYTYAGEGAPEGSTFWSRFKEHPLGPILDAATVASLGVGTAARGASIAARSGRAGFRPGDPLHRALVSTERAPIPAARVPGARAELGETVAPLQREFSTRPLRRTLQALTDQLAKVPYVGTPVANLQGRVTTHQAQRQAYSAKELEGNMAAAKEIIDPLVPLLNRLDPDEVEAIPLIGMRLGRPEFSNLLQVAVREGIEGEAPEGQRAADYAAITPELAESRAAMSDRTRELAADPSKSENLTTFLNAYTDILERRVYPDFSEEKLEENINLPRQALLERYGIEEPEAPEAAEAPPSEGLQALIGSMEEAVGMMERGEFGAPDFSEGFLVPTQPATSVKYKEPGRLGRLFGQKEGFQEGRRRTFNPQNIGYQELFRTPYMGMRPDPDLVLAGVTRAGPRQFVDFLTKHERDKIETAFNEEMIFANSLKDAEGNPVEVPGNWSEDKVKARYGPDFVAVNPTIPFQFYNKEFTVAQAVKKMEAQGLDVGEIMARVGNEAEDMALESTLAAERTPNVLVPRRFAEYQRRLAGAHRPYENTAGRVLARAMNVWRTHTLTYMPRWALNTAVGSFVLATIKGISPRQYYIAQRLRARVGGEQQGRLRSGEKGFFDEPELAGVNLASIASWDMLEMGAVGHADPLNIKVGAVSRPIMRRVQQVEDHFRRASFVQSLDRRSRQAMNESGAIISNLERSRGPRTVEEYADFVMENPDLVQGAIRDLNHFSYNFATLGPGERRYVRQVIPFWGWYKFISSLAYRLPVDYPGRSNVLAQVGMLGAAATEEELGDIPAWLKGAIPLAGPGKGFKYLSTMGINPFSQVFNPLGPEGAVAGAVQLGQASPLIQSLLIGYGIDPLRGGEVPISPQTLEEAGIGRDFFGALVSQTTGEEKDPAQVGAKERVLGNLIRSFPWARIMERQQAGGRSSFPESLPWAPRPMPTKPESRYGSTIEEVLQQAAGVAPRPYDLRGWQNLARKRARYARTRNRSDLRRLNKNLARP